MKIIKYILYIIAVLSAYSCNQSKQGDTLKLKYENIPSTSYEIAVPTSMNRDSRSLPNHLVMVEQESSILKMILVDGVSSDFSYTDFRAKVSEDVEPYEEKFNAREIYSSDTLYQYNIDKGLFHAEMFYARKEINGNIFYIQISGIPENEALPIINSFREIQPSNNENSKVSNFTLYQNNYFSLEYPKDWSVAENINEMTDVAIGSKSMAFTVVRFITSEKLTSIKNEGIKNSKLIGLKATNVTKVQVNKTTAYKIVEEGTINNLKTMHISYIFKKKDMFYCIKFGSEKHAIDANSKTIEHIIKSFQFK